MEYVNQLNIHSQWTAELIKRTATTRYLHRYWHHHRHRHQCHRGPGTRPFHFRNATRSSSNTENANYRRSLYFFMRDLRIGNETRSEFRKQFQNLTRKQISKNDYAQWQIENIVKKWTSTIFFCHLINLEFSNSCTEWIQFVEVILAYVGYWSNSTAHKMKINSNLTLNWSESLK